MITNKKVLGFIVISLIFIPVMIFMIHGSIVYHNYNSYDEHMCEITIINYSNRLPMIHNLNHWIRCDSGGYTGCMKLYANNTSNSMIKNKYSINNLNGYFETDKECTFRYGNCETSVSIIIELIREMEFVKNNTLNHNLTCYYKKMNSDIYLNETYGLIFCLWIASVVILSLSVIILISRIVRVNEINQTSLLQWIENQNIQHEQIGPIEVPPKYDELSIRSNDDLLEQLPPSSISPLSLPPIEEYNEYIQDISTEHLSMDDPPVYFESLSI